MLIEELCRRAPAHARSQFDPKRHAELYKAQPRERRRIVNALVRAGGEMDYARLLTDTSSAPESVRLLCDLGLIAAIPEAQAPQMVVLPLERLFATPLVENDPDKLVEALKMYLREVLWAVASASGVAMDGADEFTLRARLFHQAVARNTWDGLSNEALRVFDAFRSRGWIQDANQLFRHVVRGRPDGGARTAESLFTTFGKAPGLGELLGHMLVIPVRVGPGASFYRDLAVPRELRTAAQGLPKPALLPAVEVKAQVARVPASVDPAKRPSPAPAKPSSDCVKEGRFDLTSREGKMPGDLARLLLLVEQEPPSITRRGSMNRRDLNRLAKRGGFSEREAFHLGIAAACLEMLGSNGETARVSKSAAEILKLSPAEVAKRFLSVLPPITFQLRYVWLGEEQFVRLTRMARAELDSRLKDPQTIVCAHCFETEFAQSAALRKELYSPVAPVDKVARLLLDGLGDMYHMAGVVEAAFDSKGVAALRLTPTGAAALGRAPIPERAAPKDGPLIVQPSGEIIAPRSLPFDELRRLARSCDVGGVDAVAVFALNRKSLLRAAQRGEDVEALRALLASRSKAPIPQTVRVLLDEIVARTGEIEIIPCSAVVRVMDPALAANLGPGATPLPEGLVVMPCGADAHALAAELRKKGYLPRIKATEVGGVESKAGRSVRAFGDREFTDIDDIWGCLDDAEAGKTHVKIRLKGGRVLAGTVALLDDDHVEIVPLYGGKTEAHYLRDIRSAWSLNSPF